MGELSKLSELSNCYNKEKEEIKKKVQLAATGATKGTSHNLLYSETMIEPLATDRRKLTQLYKIKRRMALTTITELLPMTRQRTAYLLRSRENLTQMNTSTKGPYESFIPSTIRKLNELPKECCQAGSVEPFKDDIAFF